MTSPRHNPARLFVLAVAALLIVGASFALAAETSGASSSSALLHKKHKKKKRQPKPTISTTQHKASSAARTPVSHSARKPGVRNASARSRAIPKSSKARLARLHLQSNRITEIQEALIGVGYLTPPASGSWDDTTRAAMRHYQVDNGFGVTGLPDAKSLMKLGLGPHPLPSELQPATAAAQVTAPPTTKTEPN